MNKTSKFAIACVAAIALSWISTAQAFDGYGGYWGQFPWFGYGNNGPAAYALGNIPAPPYFALHPPVYYSHPTPRTYGHSPFASSCDCHQARQQAATRIVVNPHIVKPAEAAEKPVKIARMKNPFYEAVATSE